MNKEQLSEQIVTLINGSGLSYDDQVKAISMARTQIMPHKSWEEVKASAKPILKPKEQKGDKGR